MLRSNLLGSRMLAVTAVVLLAAGATHTQTAVVDPAASPLPNPNPTVITNWAPLPDGRVWGSTAGIDIGPDGHVWAYDRCGAVGLAGGCDTSDVAPVFKFHRETGEVLANFGAGLFVLPHGLHVDVDGNVWVTDSQGNDAGTKGHQVIKFSPEGEILMRLGQAGVAGSGPGLLNQPNDVITAPNGDIFVADGHSGQSDDPPPGSTGRIMKFTSDGELVMEWGRIGSAPGEFRTPHALAFDSRGRLFVADRGNHRIQIFGQEGNFLESYERFSRVSGLFIDANDILYVIDSESNPTRHPDWKTGIRIGHVDEDRVTAFIPPHDSDSGPQGVAGEGVAVDADGNVYAAEGPISLAAAGGGLTKYLRAATGSAMLSPGDAYFPDRSDWEWRAPEEAGFDAAALAEAVEFAVASQTTNPREQALVQATTFGASEPFDAIVGPTSVHNGLTGIIIHQGRVVAEWGDTERVDMTHSVTKTFLSTVVGLAWRDGLIRDIRDPARDYMPLGVDLFEAPHNQAITWDDLLRQTSDWQGTLWDKPDWADRPEGEPREWPNRTLHESGTRYKYNDVRVNALALAALHVFRRPLPEVLREEVMDVIGASSTWRWHGYENSWIELDGRRVQSVSGGGHWGGGMFINAWDMARFGYLFLRNGQWGDRRIVPEAWIEMARTGGPANDEYGFMNWFLNPDRRVVPAAPSSSVIFRGAGTNIVYVDWDHDLVVVLRWVSGMPAWSEFIGQVLASME